MERQKSCGPRLGKLVHQLPGVVTFAYDLRFRRVIARWKGIVEEIHFGGSIMPSTIIQNLYLEKTSFRPSKWPRKLKPAKNSKLSKMARKLFWAIWKRWVAPDIHLDHSFSNPILGYLHFHFHIFKIYIYFHFRNCIFLEIWNGFGYSLQGWTCSFFLWEVPSYFEPCSETIKQICK